ncbi:MAG TPA: hypothetical protein VIM06_02940 [Rhodanobacter sp.]
MSGGDDVRERGEPTARRRHAHVDLAQCSRHAAQAVLPPISWSIAMPNNPMNPQPPFAEPGKQLPERELEDPGHSHPERDADPEPLQQDDDDELSWARVAAAGRVDQRSDPRPNLTACR